MKKTIILLLLITFIAFSFSGCYDANSLETFYYVIALGVDKGTDSPLKLSVQIAISDKNSDSSSQSTNQSIFSVDCTSINSGLSILDNYLSKKLDLSHCSAVIFSEELAKEGIALEINTLANNNEIRPNANVLISNKTALDVLEKVSASGENFSSRYYEFIINSTNYTGYSTISRFGDIFYDFNNNVTQATANYIAVNGETIQSNGVAVFKNDVFVGSLDAIEAIAHSIVINELDTATVSITDPFEPNELMDILINLEKTDIDISIVNKTPYIKVKSKVNGKVRSATNDFDYSSLTSIDIIENSLEKYLKEIINTYLYTISREFNADICYFGEMLSTKYPTTTEFDKVHWEEIFKDSVFDISVDCQINSSYLFNKE
ncbi:MAG: Ger(x)C family spore germination protein [Candidatus Scatovivens sp.]